MAPCASRAKEQSASAPTSPPALRSRVPITGGRRNDFTIGAVTEGTCKSMVCTGITAVAWNQGPGERVSRPGARKDEVSLILLIAIFNVSYHHNHKFYISSMAIVPRTSSTYGIRSHSGGLAFQDGALKRSETPQTTQNMMEQNSERDAKK